MKAPPVAVHVCVTVSWFVTVTVVPTGTDTADGLKAKFEMLIATGAGGKVVVVVVVVGGGGCVVGGGVASVVDGGVWLTTPDVAPLEGAPLERGAVDGAPDGFPVVVVAPLFGAPPAFSVAAVDDPFPAGLVVVVPLLRGEEWLEWEVDCFPLLKAAGAPPQAAVNVAKVSPTSNRMVRDLRAVCILQLPVR